MHKNLEEGTSIVFTINQKLMKECKHTNYEEKKMVTQDINWESARIFIVIAFGLYITTTVHYLNVINKFVN